MKAINCKKILFSILIALCFSTMASAKIVYVSTTGNGTNDGLSWSSPKLTLAQAYPLCVAGDQIWVKAGTYPKPTAALAVILTNISIYGGFAGTETTLAQRNWVVNKTILDGGNEKQLFYTGSSSGTSYDASNLLIDGFTMQNGSGPNGGAIIFAGNLSTNILVQNCIFRNNSATTNGGAISVSNGNSVSFYNCLFMNNQCGALASAVNATASATAKLYNCTFVNNANLKSVGGSLIQFAGTNNTIINCIFWNNISTVVTPTKNSPVVFTGTSPVAKYIASDNSISIATDTIRLNPSNTNIAGPNFKNPGSTIGAVADVTLLDGLDYSLQDASPCVNAGKDSVVVGNYDLALQTRIFGGRVDLGAYENQNKIYSGINNLAYSNSSWVSVLNKTITVHGLSENARIKLFTLDGRIILSKTIDINNSIELPSRGSYILHISQSTTEQNIKVIL